MVFFSTATKKRRERLTDIFQHRATTNAKGLKIRALEARMTIIMEETARFNRSDARRTGGGSDDEDPSDSLDSSVHDRLLNKEEYCRLAKDLLAMKEVIVLVNYILFYFYFWSIFLSGPRRRSHLKKTEQGQAQKETG